jgi:hypothetical protein
MDTKVISIKKTPKVQHEYFSSLIGSNGVNNQRQAFAVVLDSHKIVSKLGLDSGKVAKLEMMAELLSKDGENVALDVLVNRLIETAFSKAVNVVELDKSEVVSDKTIQSSGSARLRVQHFVDMIKEHNSKSSDKLMITQTLLADGLTSGNSKRSIDLSKIMASDKSYFESGTNANRGAIKAVVLDNKGFKAYNSSISEKSSRAHNSKTIKSLSNE